MGNCFSFVTRQGRKRLRMGFEQKSFQTNTTGKSPASASSKSRRSVSSKATEECEAEAASGYFSFGSDISTAHIQNADDYAGATDSQMFGILMAQETTAERRKSTKSRDSPGLSRSPKRPPAMPTTKTFGDHDHDHRKGSPRVPSLTRPPSIPSSTKACGDHGRIRNSPGGPRPVERAGLDHGHIRNSSPGGPRPLQKTALDHGRMRSFSPGGPQLLEKPGLSAIADSLNAKGRQELERLRGFSPENAGSLKKVRANNENFNRNGTGRSSGPLYSRQHVPVDFDFLVKDSSRRGKQTSQAPKDGLEPPKQTDENDPIDHSGASKSSLRMQVIDDLAKTYKESAAKAAARDRDMFKSMSTGESIDVSVTSSMGSSPAIRHQIRPEIRSRRNSLSTSSSAVPELEPEIVPAPVTFGTLINLDSPSKFKTKAASPSIPRSAVTKNRTAPVLSRPAMTAAGGRGGPPAARSGSPAARGGSPAARSASPVARGGTRRAHSLQPRNV